MLHYLGLLTCYDTRAVRGNLVDDRIEEWFELLVGKSDASIVDP